MTGWLWLWFVGCIDDGVVQVAGTGATYTTRCSAEMEIAGPEYRARCTPPSCAARYTDVAVNHVVVALDPGTRLVGYAERICVQDLSTAAAVFSPVIEPSNPNKSPTPSPDPDVSPTPK